MFLFLVRWELKIVRKKKQLNIQWFFFWWGKFEDSEFCYTLATNIAMENGPCEDEFPAEHRQFSTSMLAIC